MMELALVSFKPIPSRNERLSPQQVGKLADMQVEYCLHVGHTSRAVLQAELELEIAAKHLYAFALQYGELEIAAKDLYALQNWM